MQLSFLSFLGIDIFSFTFTLLCSVFYTLKLTELLNFPITLFLLIKHILKAEHQQNVHMYDIPFLFSGNWKIVLMGPLKLKLIFFSLFKSLRSSFPLDI